MKIEYNKDEGYCPQCESRLRGGVDSARGLTFGCVVCGWQGPGVGARDVSPGDGEYDDII